MTASETSVFQTQTRHVSESSSVSDVIHAVGLSLKMVKVKSLLLCFLFDELCAGSARLSSAIRSLGYQVVPIDHKHNKHHPHSGIV